MNAAFILDGKVSVGEVPDPTLAKGQVLVRTHSCGLCASDSHFLQSGADVVGLCQRHGGP